MNKELFGTYLGTTGNSTKAPVFKSFLKKLVKENGWFNRDYNVQDEYLDLYPKWIASSKLNTVLGLETFPYKFVSLGTTQALDWFIFDALSNNRTMRFYKGEYPYNRDIFKFNFRTDFINDRELTENDSVIISAPFSGTGNEHSQYDNLMKQCNDLNIPVMVDCAWFGTCYDTNIDLTHDCIKVAAFSTTKGLNTGNYRAGIAFSKWNHGPLSVQTEWYHGIHMNTYISYKLMQEFSPDTIPTLFKQSQTEVCEYYGLQPSKTIHIAAPIENDSNWDYFSRDGVYNRVNIKDILLDHYENNEWKR